MSVSLTLLTNRSCHVYSNLSLELPFLSIGTWSYDIWELADPFEDIRITSHSEFPPTLAQFVELREILGLMKFQMLIPLQYEMWKTV
jgi:hypothetical protein